MKKYILITIVIVLIGLVGCGSKEIENSKLDEKLSFNKSPLSQSTYEASGDKLTVSLTYENNIMLVGVVKRIRTLIENEFATTYKVIDLNIVQTDPADSVFYKYKDNKWDKEVG